MATKGLRTSAASCLNWQKLSSTGESKCCQSIASYKIVAATGGQVIFTPGPSLLMFMENLE